ncbi:MAG TPA: nucleotidyltransferase family protein [Thermoleophilaceae bacterium]
MPQEPASQFTTGLVMAAGGSSRLGRPKQLLPYGEGTLLGHVVDTARRCSFDQLLVAVGGSADEVTAGADLNGVEVVVNEEYGTGCASSLRTGIQAADPRWTMLVLILGDQPGVTPASVEALLAGRGDAPLAVCRYDDARGHPLAVARELESGLLALHGDKGVWKLMDRLGDQVAEVRVPGPVPVDVDTWDDYEAVLAAAAR